MISGAPTQLTTAARCTGMEDEMTAPARIRKSEIERTVNTLIEAGLSIERVIVDHGAQTVTVETRDAPDDSDPYSGRNYSK